MEAGEDGLTKQRKLQKPRTDIIHFPYTPHTFFLVDNILCIL